MSNPWFDENTNVLLFDEYVSEAASFRKIMADGIVTEQELHDQAHMVVSLLKELEVKLSPEIKPLVTSMLTELAVLHTMQAFHNRQNS